MIKGTIRISLSQIIPFDCQISHFTFQRMLTTVIQDQMKRRQRTPN